MFNDALLNIENINRVLNVLNVVDKKLYTKVSEASRQCFGTVVPVRLMYHRYNITTIDTVKIESPSTVKLVSLRVSCMALNDKTVNTIKVYFPYNYLTMECKDIEDSLYDDEYHSLLRRIKFYIDKNKDFGETNYIMNMTKLYKLL